ncbi:MAG: SPOR domain-containing protein [Spirochaetota bacterium]|jgi:tetratricopeptide (TPR) repeat protein|nr:SPOR domain-containing protein [Spirochaetota bacterium]
MTPRALLCVSLLFLSALAQADSLDDAQKILDTSEAKAAFQKAVRDLPRGARHAEALGQLIMLESESAEKKLLLKQFVETYPDHERVIQHRWDLYHICLGDYSYSEASRIILPLLERKESRERALAALAVVSLELGKVEEGMAYLDSFFHENNTSGLIPRMLLCRAELQLMQGNAERAKKDYEEILAKYAQNPLAAAAHLALSEIAGNTGNIPEARTHLDALIAAFPNSFEASLARGRRNALPGETKQTREVRVWEVQLAAFFAPKQAETFVSQLAAKGYVSFVDEAMENGRKQYSVRMGYFRTRNDAERVMQELAAKGYPGFIRTRTVRVAEDALD